MTSKYRVQFGYDAKAASDEVAIAPGGPSLTVQSQSEDADINVMMQRYGITGKFPENPRVPSYGDFSEISDFRSALQAVASASEAFMQYPASFRARFENNPQLFLDFCSDARNLGEMKTLGLLKENLNASGGSGSSEGAQAGGAPGAGAASGGVSSGAVDSGAQSGGSVGQAGSAAVVR